MARPKKSVDARLVRQLAGLACSVKDIATMVGCSVDTLERRFAEEIAKGRAECRTTLRRRQWEAAMDGNTALLIFLGKNLLDQTDRADITSAKGPIISPMIKYDVQWEIPRNGRDPSDDAAELAADDPSPPRAARPAARPDPPNGGGEIILPNGKRAYRWSNGKLMSFREPES